MKGFDYSYLMQQLGSTILSKQDIERLLQEMGITLYRNSVSDTIKYLKRTYGFEVYNRRVGVDVGGVRRAIGSYYCANNLKLDEFADNYASPKTNRTCDEMDKGLQKKWNKLMRMKLV